VATIEPPLVPPRPEVDDPVGGLDDVEVMLDNQHRVAVVDEPVEHLEQHAHVLEMEPCGWLVEDVQRALGIALGQLGCELHALRFTAGEGRGALP
jgi:hypothetical protein